MKPVYLGENTIDAFYVGDKPALDIYLGNVLILQGTSPAFNSFPLTGDDGAAINEFYVHAVDFDSTVISTYTGNVTLSIASGTGTLSGTTTKACVAGIATFDDIQFDGEDDYTLTATLGANTATSGTISITNPIVYSPMWGEGEGTFYNQLYMKPTSDTTIESNVGGFNGSTNSIDIAREIGSRVKCTIPNVEVHPVGNTFGLFIYWQVGQYHDSEWGIVRSLTASSGAYSIGIYENDLSISWTRDDDHNQHKWELVRTANGFDYYEDDVLVYTSLHYDAPSTGRRWSPYIISSAGSGAYPITDCYFYIPSLANNPYFDDTNWTEFESAGSVTEYIDSSFDLVSTPTYGGSEYIQLKALPSTSEKIYLSGVTKSDISGLKASIWHDGALDNDEYFHLGFSTPANYTKSRTSYSDLAIQYQYEYNYFQNYLSGVYNGYNNYLVGGYTDGTLEKHTIYIIKSQTSGKWEAYLNKVFIQEIDDSVITATATPWIFIRRPTYAEADRVVFGAKVYLNS